MSNLVKYVVGAAVAAIVIFLVWYFSNIVAYILVSAILAIIGKPLVDSLCKIHIRNWRIPKWLAALFTLLVMWAVTILFLVLFIPLVFHKVSELSNLDITFVTEAFQKPLDSLQEFLAKYFSVQSTDFSIVTQLTEYGSKLLNLDTLNKTLASMVTVVTDTFIALFSISFITFFFLKQDKLFQNMLVAVFPKKYEENILRALDSVTNLLIRYFTGILAESTIMMLLLSTIFMIWGFSAETAFFMGLVVGVLNVIPYIGPLIGAVICVIVGIISPLPGMGIGGMFLIIAGSVIFAQLVDNIILQPFLYSNRVKAHPLEIFIVILIAGSVAGVLGMLLAIPSYTVLRVFAKEFFNNFRLVQKLTENI